MKNGLIVPVTALVIISSALFAGNGYAFGPGGHHHGASAIGPCIAVMSASQKANLKQTFSNEKQTLQTDRQNVASAKQALVTAILSPGNQGLSTQESNLATAQQQLQKDEDTTAQQVCGQLSSTQLSAALTLFNNLTTLHANTRQQAKAFFQQAQAAAGNTQSQSAE